MNPIAKVVGLGEKEVRSVTIVHRTLPPLLTVAKMDPEIELMLR